MVGYLSNGAPHDFFIYGDKTTDQKESSSFLQAGGCAQVASAPHCNYDHINDIDQNAVSYVFQDAARESSSELEEPQNCLQQRVITDVVVNAQQDMGENDVSQDVGEKGFRYALQNCWGRCKRVFISKGYLLRIKKQVCLLIKAILLLFIAIVAVFSMAAILLTCGNNIVYFILSGVEGIYSCLEHVFY